MCALKWYIHVHTLNACQKEPEKSLPTSIVQLVKFGLRRAIVTGEEGSVGRPDIYVHVYMYIYIYIYIYVYVYVYVYMGECHIIEEGLHGSRGGRSAEGGLCQKDV